MKRREEEKIITEDPLYFSTFVRTFFLRAREPRIHIFLKIFKKYHFAFISFSQEKKQLFDEHGRNSKK